MRIEHPGFMPTPVEYRAGWELQRLVYLTGQVKHPGRYALTLIRSSHRYS